MSLAFLHYYSAPPLHVKGLSMHQFLSSSTGFFRPALSFVIWCGQNSDLSRGIPSSRPIWNPLPNRHLFADMPTPLPNILSLRLLEIPSNALTLGESLKVSGWNSLPVGYHHWDCMPLLLLKEKTAAWWSVDSRATPMCWILAFVSPERIAETLLCQNKQFLEQPPFSPARNVSTALSKTLLQREVLEGPMFLPGNPFREVLQDFRKLGYLRYSLTLFT